MVENILIMPTSERDFHDFNTLFRDPREVRVVAFTATQIPLIENRTYAHELAGKLYPEGIPVFPSLSCPN